MKISTFSVSFSLEVHFSFSTFSSSIISIIHKKRHLTGIYGLARIRAHVLKFVCFNLHCSVGMFCFLSSYLISMMWDDTKALMKVYISKRMKKYLSPVLAVSSLIWCRSKSVLKQTLIYCDGFWENFKFLIKSFQRYF